MDNKLLFLENGLAFLEGKENVIVDSVDYKISYQNTFQNLQKTFNFDFSIKLFEDRISEIINDINQNLNINKINNGTHFPFYLPKLQYEDPGEFFEKFMFPRFNDIFQKQFENKNKEDLLDRLTDSSKSHYDYLLEKNEEKDMIGLFFPCLRFFTISECKEFISELPQNFILSGPMEITSTFIGNPKLINYFPNDTKLWMAGITSETSGTGFNLTFKDKKISFFREHHGSELFENFCCGISVILN